MSQSDMFVVMCKIIAYLYDCMRRGEDPSPDGWGPEAMGVCDAYWRRIVSQLVEHGYIGGVNVARTSMGTSIQPFDPFVTVEGVQFARENSTMRAAAKFLVDGGGIVASLAGALL